jgi:hypothetical protein
VIHHWCSVLSVKKEQTNKQQQQQKNGQGLSNFVKPNHQKSVLSKEVVHSIIVAHIEMFLSFFESPTHVNLPCTVHVLKTSCGTGISRYIPNDRNLWEMVSQIDEDASHFMLEQLKMDPGNLMIGFDGVMALGKHATLYTFSKGSMSLFLTIR